MVLLNKYAHYCDNKEGENVKKCSLEAEALMLRRYYSASVAIRQGLEGNGTGGSLICSDYSKSSAARGREVSERRRRVLTSTSSPPLIHPPPSAPPPSLVPPGDWLSVTGPEMLLLVKPTASAGQAGGRAWRRASEGFFWGVER